AVVFLYGGREAMPTRGVGDEDLGPGRGQEDAAMIGVRPAERLERRLAGRMLERRRGIDEAAVEEDESTRPAGFGAILERDRHGPAGEGRENHPGKGRAIALGDDPSAGLLDNGMAAPPEFGEQGR